MTARSSMKRVELGPIVDGLRVIRSGLTPDDRVVIEGLQRARPGQKVKAEDGKIEACEIAQSRNFQGEDLIMGFSHFFIDRPIFASVISIILTLVGCDLAVARCRSPNFPRSRRRRSR